MVTALLLAASLLQGADVDLSILSDSKSTPTQRRQAWDALCARGPEALVPILRAMSPGDTVANNWLRTAFDRIAQKAFETDRQKIDVGLLRNVYGDVKAAGPARRLAMEWIEKLYPGTTAARFQGRLDDPEFRYEAVAHQLGRAKGISALPTAVKLYREAFDAARDILQAREAAAALENFGEPPLSVGQHFGFVMDWYLLGPLAAHGTKSFATVYPPEKKVDLKEELDGAKGKVGWKRFTIKEPPHRSGAKHQALLELHNKNALGLADDAVGFAYAEIEVDKAQKVEFRGAADDYFVVYVNGEKAFAFEEYQNGVRYDRHRFPVQLREGKNAILVRVYQSPPPNPQPNWEFFLRIVDATGAGLKFKSALP